MSREPHAMSVEIEQEETRRARVFGIVALATAGVALALLALFTVIGQLDAQFPIVAMVLAIGQVVLLALVGFWLGRRGSLSLAAGIYLASVTMGLFVGIYFFNGAGGPVAVGLIFSTIIAALVGKGRTVYVVALVNLAFYLAMVVLEALGVVQPGKITGVALQVVQSGVFVAALGVTTVVILIFSSSAQRALALAHERAQESAEATRQAQQAAQSAQEAREREEKAALQLRRAVQEYGDFLERVTAGDYSARLVVEDSAPGSGELVALGRRLNTTVESLVRALQDLQAVQRRYARQAWEGFTRSHAGGIGFRAHGEVAEPAGKAWLEPMTSAVRDRKAVADEQGLALPIVSRGEVIGALGARRAVAQGDWSDDEVALVTAITDQLAQTLEGLRLLDETQRLAAREQIINMVTARIRGVPTVNAILQQTVQELGRTFGASRASIHVEMSEPGASREQRIPK
jgi:hypothetical protein